MSDLIGTPENRFSRVAAHSLYQQTELFRLFIRLFKTIDQSMLISIICQAFPYFMVFFTKQARRFVHLTDNFKRSSKYVYISHFAYSVTYQTKNYSFIRAFALSRMQRTNSLRKPRVIHIQ